MQRSSNIENITETLSVTGLNTLPCTDNCSQFNIGFLSYLFPWLIISSLTQRGGELKTRSTSTRNVITSCNQRDKVLMGYVKSRSRDNVGKQIGTDSQLEGHILAHY